MTKQLSHADKFAKAMKEAAYSEERRALIEAYGNDKTSLKVALRELAYSKTT
jgi:hypothetical protein